MARKDIREWSVWKRHEMALHLRKIAEEIHFRYPGEAMLIDDLATDIEPTPEEAAGNDA